MLTEDQVSSLKKGDVLYNNAIWGTKSDGTIVHYKAKVIGVPRKNGKDRSIQIKRLYGNHGEGVVSVEGRKLWRLTEEKGPEDIDVMPTELKAAAPRRVVMKPLEGKKAETQKKAEKPVKVEQPQEPASTTMRVRRQPRPSKLSEAEVADLFKTVDSYFS
jgi:hypothetical protein